MRHVEREEEMKANRRRSLENKSQRIHRPNIGTDDIKSEGIKAHSLRLCNI